jgi:Fuc2NAc and GlcNAc transferase
MPRAMLLAALAGAVLTGTLIPPLAAWARRRNYLDIPNHRSSHVVATPRIGGIALVLGVVAGAAVLHLLGGGLDRGPVTVLAGALGIALLGLIDDFQQLSPVVRLVVQTAIAAAVVFAGSGPSAMGDALVPRLLAVFWLVTLINAFNFMDGIDGIAGAQALVAGCGWVAVGLLAGVPQITALGLLIAAASIGFLLHNWHPAKVFMGDAGSGFFGFLLAALPLLEPDRNTVPLWLCAVLLMWPFLADTGITLIRRAIRGENLLSAHRSHIYQRLVLGGRSHSYVALVYAGLAVLGIVASIAVVLATKTWF